MSDQGVKLSKIPLGRSNVKGNLLESNEGQLYLAMAQNLTNNVQVQAFFVEERCIFSWRS